MFDWLFLDGLIAQADKAPQNPPGFGALVPPMLAMIFLFYFLILRPQRRDQRKRDEMLQTLKKNDRVVTIGGMIGTVANITPDGKEITLKVDDNTRIKFLRSSIQSVLTDTTEDDSAKKL